MFPPTVVKALPKKEDVSTAYPSYPRGRKTYHRISQSSCSNDAGEYVLAVLGVQWFAASPHDRQENEM